MLAVSHANAPSHRAMDESGTIDPAALDTRAPSTISPTLLTQPTPSRRTKRSRSPDQYVSRGHDAVTDEGNAKKRSRSMRSSEGITMSSQQQQPVQTPQIRTQSLPQATPTQASPTQASPSSGSKPAVVKALPTVRDHTTDQLGPDGDEYIPRETDPDGENKVSRDGQPLDGRRYRCRTFKVPNRGDKLFMLATECARVLGYRDSYLLFNKNRSLFKIIANQPEKDDLIHQEILPYSYRSRQIAIVTARSMFRQFGSRLIENGRRVRDDYWEAKARKQGFTEEDAAGEKRPGGAKAREAAAAEASSAAAAAALVSLPHGEIIYSTGPGIDGQPPSLDPAPMVPLPMIHLPPDDLRAGGFGMRPRQEISGPPYQGRTQPSTANDILTQATSAAEYNKQLRETRGHRASYLGDFWRRPHEQPPEPQVETGPANVLPPPQTTLQSPQTLPHLTSGRLQQEQMSHVGSGMMQQPYAPFPGPQHPMASPVQSMHRTMPTNQMHQGSPPLGMGTASSSHRQSGSYSNYPQNQMWQAPQQQTPQQPQPPAPSQSPLAQSQHMLQYASQTQPQQPQMLPPHMSPGGAGAYQPMSQMSTPGYALTRNIYQQQPQQQPSPSPQHYGLPPGSAQQSQQQQQQQQQQHGAPQQGSLQGWSTQGSAAGGNLSQDWQRY